MMPFFVWWLSCYVVWAAIMFWSDWSECKNRSMRAGFLTGIVVLIVTWPLSVVAHAVAETKWGRDRAMIPLFPRWRSK